MSGTLTNEGKDPDPEPEPDQGCKHGFKFWAACPRCNPVVGEHTDKNPNQGRRRR